MRPALQPGPDGGSRLQELVTRWAKFAVSALGVGGILYAAGFLAIRSHFSFLGIWGGAPAGTSQVAEEGGRFAYHLLFAAASLIVSANGLIIAGLLGTALIADTNAPEWISRRFQFFARVPKPRLRTAPAVIAVLSLCATALILETNWQVASYQDVLRAPSSLPGELRSAGARSDLYRNCLFRVLVCGGIAWFLYRSAAKNVSRVARFATAAQWLLFWGALLLLPALYGRLVITSDYPAFGIPLDPADRVLVGQTDQSWVVWNRKLLATEIISRDKADVVTLGKRNPLLE